MPNDKTRVAVVGGGVAGLSASWFLHTQTENVDVELFEADPRLGGHAYTVDVNGTDVDIGFMVFNDQNYPNLTNWFDTLGVEQEDCNMSLSISLDQGKTVEWCSSGLNGLFAKKTQAFSPGFYRFVNDMLRFNARAADLLLLPDDDPRKLVTTGEFLRNEGYSTDFCNNYLLPMMAALWSASMDDVLQFPAAQLIGFLCNHKMLQIWDRQQWRTVTGRSVQYTSKVGEILGAKAHTSAPVESVTKTPEGTYEVVSNGNSMGIFDQVIFACHPPTAEAILKRGKNQDDALLELLHNIEYADNVIYVHSDPKLMPARKSAWASWNCLGQTKYMQTLSSKKGEAMEGSESGFGHKSSDAAQEHLEGSEGRMKAVYVTYWLNYLQNLACDKNVFVSLNPHSKPDPALTYKRVILAHPQFNPGTLAARQRFDQRQGKDGLWFCGAWEGYGFHEDGCRSGFRVVTRLTDKPLPWARETPLKVLPPPDLSLVKTTPSILRTLYRKVTYDVPVAVCKQLCRYFINQAIQVGKLVLKMNDGTSISFGDGSKCGADEKPVVLRIYDDWFFVKLALEYDLGLARSYMAGHFLVEGIDAKDYHSILRPADSDDETSLAIGDPIGLTRLFLLFIGNRDRLANGHVPAKSSRAHLSSNAFTNASGMVLGKLGSFLNFLRFRFTMDNSERGGSRKNIHAHYDLSNDLFTTFLDKETLIYSSAIYDAKPKGGELVFGGSLEEAQWRKLDTLLARAQIQPGQSLLDIGFGWGGLSIHAAKKYGCRVTGITLSVEQKALAEKRVKEAGVEHLMNFQVVDYRTFCRRDENRGKFDRVISCEMIEAVGHKYLKDFFWAVEQVLAPDGVFVMEAITTPEARYERYLRTTDFINTIIFPGGQAPSLHALVDAAYKGSTLTLEHIDNIGLHYAETLREWRRRFNRQTAHVRSLGFDDVFLRVWNYYLTYCEAGFYSQTINCLILVFARHGCRSLIPLSDTRVVTQPAALTDREVDDWVTEASQ